MGFNKGDIVIEKLTGDKMIVIDPEEYNVWRGRVIECRTIDGGTAYRIPEELISEDKDE